MGLAGFVPYLSLVKYLLSIDLYTDFFLLFLILAGHFGTYKNSINPLAHSSEMIAPLVLFFVFAKPVENPDRFSAYQLSLLCFVVRTHQPGSPKGMCRWQGHRTLIWIIIEEFL